MSEVPRLPDNSGGDDDRKWLMDPNAGKNELAVVDQGGDGAEQPTESAEPSTEVNPTESTESSTEVNPAEVDSATAEGSEEAESAEAKEAERLHKEIAQNYTSDIFKAARKIEKPVSNAMDVFGWSREDQQRLLDALNNADEQSESNDENASMGNGGVEQGLGDSAAGQQGESNAASEAAPREPEADSSDSGESDDSNAAAAATAAAAAGVAAGVAAERANGAGGEEEEVNEDELAEEANRIEDSNQPESEKKKERKKFLKKLATRGIVVALALATVLGIGLSGKKGKQEVKDTTPIVQEIEDDQEENESIHDRSTYHGMFASEDGSTYNSEKLGKHNFGESLGSNLSEDEMRQELGDRMIQPGQLAATYYYMQEKTADPNFGVDGARFDNPDALLEAMEADGDLHQRVYDYVMSIFENGSFTEDSVTGTFHNFFMDSEFETGDSDTSNIEVVGCTTQEDGTKVYTVRRVWIDENNNEHTDIFTFKERCGGQPLDEYDFTTSVRQIPEDEEDTPDDDTDKDEDEDDDDDDDDEDESKTPFDQDKVEEGLEDLTVDQQDQNGTVSDKPTETADYDANENNDGSDGAEHNEKAPDSDEQVGAQDTNEQSADDSGRTVAEVVEEAEDDGGAGGENTSGQENRTAEDQAQHDADEAGAAAQQQANENEDRSAGEASETMTDDEAANAFANGDF